VKPLAPVGHGRDRADGLHASGPVVGGALQVGRDP
jgi:hypothetical protein